MLSNSVGRGDGADDDRELTTVGRWVHHADPVQYPSRRAPQNGDTTRRPDDFPGFDRDILKVVAVRGEGRVLQVVLGGADDLDLFAGDDLPQAQRKERTSKG